MMTGCTRFQAFLLSTRTLPGECAPTTAAVNFNTDTKDDYDIHIPLSAMPLGVNLGPSLEVLSFVKDAKTGELPWIARRGWLEVGDALVSIVSPEEEHVPEVSTTAVYVVLRSAAWACTISEARRRCVLFIPRVFAEHEMCMCICLNYTIQLLAARFSLTPHVSSPYCACLCAPLSLLNLKGSTRLLIIPVGAISCRSSVLETSQPPCRVS